MWKVERRKEPLLLFSSGCFRPIGGQGSNLWTEVQLPTLEPQASEVGRGGPPQPLATPEAAEATMGTGETAVHLLPRSCFPALPRGTHPNNLALTGVAQSVERCSASLIPGQGTCLGGRPM